MNYTLHQLKIFLKVAKTRSITKAAEELYLTQPAVSIQLKNFQDQFELPLLEVISKKIYITDFGKEIAAAAEKILLEVHEIQQKMHTYQGKLTGKLKLSVVSTGKYIAPYLLADFIHKHPQIELQMDVTNKAQVIESLEKNEVDFSLVSVLPDQIQIEKEDLMPNKLYLVGNAESQLTQKIYDKRIFQHIPLIYRETGSGTRHVMEAFIKKNKIPVKMNMELTSNEAVKQAVMAGLGYAIMPIIGIRNELSSGQLRIISVKGFPVKSTWSLIWLRGKKMTPVSQAFLQHLQIHKQQIIEENFNRFMIHNTHE